MVLLGSGVEVLGSGSGVEVLGSGLGVEVLGSGVEVLGSGSGVGIKGRGIGVMFSGMNMPNCVTLIVRVIPPPATVIVPLLCAPVLAVAFIVKFMLSHPPERDAVIQETLLVINQFVFELIVTLVLDADIPGFHEEIDRVSVGS